MVSAAPPKVWTIERNSWAELISKEIRKNCFKDQRSMSFDQIKTAVKQSVPEVSAQDLEDALLRLQSSLWLHRVPAKFSLTAPGVRLWARNTTSY